MSKVSFEGIGEVAATFACGDQVQAGHVVTVSAEGAVGPCTSGGRFCGVAISAESGYAAVQVAGFAPVLVSGSGVSAGLVKLSADGTGGVKLDATAGTEYLVVQVDDAPAGAAETVTGLATILL